MVFALYSKVVQNLAAAVEFVRLIIKTLNCCAYRRSRYLVTTWYRPLSVSFDWLQACQSETEAETGIDQPRWGQQEPEYGRSKGATTMIAPAPLQGSDQTAAFVYIFCFIISSWFVPAVLEQDPEDN